MTDVTPFSICSSELFFSASSLAMSSLAVSQLTAVDRCVLGDGSEGQDCQQQGGTGKDRIRHDSCLSVRKQ